MRLSYFILVTLAVIALFIVPAAASPGEVFSISGQVVDRYGNPVQGADVSLIDNSFKTIAIKNTNENGNYDFINVASDTDTVTVRVNVTRNGTTYSIPPYYTRWYPSKSIQFIPTNETSFPNYPPPVYGYIYGAIQTGEGNVVNYIPGIVYLVSLDNDIKYYVFAGSGDGQASYTFYAPAGQYMLYAQHWENGVVYESAHKAVNITPNGDITEGLETRIVLPLKNPSSNTDPATEPARRANKVGGTLATTGDRPLPGVAVTLYQKSDNGSAFLPMLSNGMPVTATTDGQGRYEFNGVVPTTDDGKAIQAEKDIKAMAEYPVTDNLTMAAQTDVMPLYYPDVILGYGKEEAARNVTFQPVVVNAGNSLPAETPLPTASVPVSVEWMPLLAALAAGIVCLIGLYLFLNRKGQ